MLECFERHIGFDTSIKTAQLISPVSIVIQQLISAITSASTRDGDTTFLPTDEELASGEVIVIVSESGGQVGERKRFGAS